MPNSNEHSLTSALKQNWLLAGLTAISLSVGYADRLLPVLAKQPSTEATPTASALSQFCKGLPSRQVFVRTELFFGRGKSDGSEVTELEFQQFLDREVTSRFPDGLTLLSGRGQFKEASGRVIQEPAKLLILLYPLERSQQHNQQIEHIRSTYKTTFQQGSVLRTDALTCGSF